MINNYVQRKKQSTHRQAFAVIVRYIKAASYQVMALYLQHSSVPSPESFIRIYYRWLIATIKYLPTDDQEDIYTDLLELIEKDIMRYASYGKRAKPLRLKETGISLRARGIGFAAFELCNFVNHAWEEMCNIMCKEPLESRHLCAQCDATNGEFEESLSKELRRIFQQFWRQLAPTLENLGIEEPPHFFMEYFAKMLGWNVGAWADLVEDSTDAFLADCLYNTDTMDHKELAKF